MAKQIRLLNGLMLPLLLVACTNPPAPPTLVPTAAPPTSSPEATVRVAGSGDLFCPSANEAASRAYNTGIDLRNQGQFEAAIESYSQAIALGPEFCDAMDNLGQLLRQQGKLAEVVAWYQKSLAIVPHNSVALQNLGLAYKLQGDTEAALETFERLTQVDPENPEGYYGLGTIYFDQDELTAAIYHLSIAEKLYLESGSPYVTDAQYYLGFAHFMEQDCAQAKKYMEPLYAQFAEQGGINYVLGVCYVMGEPQDIPLAREYILKAQAAGFEIPATVLEAINSNEME